MTCGCNNCNQCPYPDCINDELTLADYERSNLLDNEVKDSTLDKHQLAKKMANKRYREKNKDRIRAKDRERYTGKRKESVNATNKVYQEEHRQEINEKSLNYYYIKKNMNVC